MLCFLWCLFQVGSVATVLALIAMLVLIRRSDADHLTLLWEKYGTKPETLAGKVVWVTGASSGIGKHLAYQLTQLGCKVILSARREEQLKEVKAGCLAIEKCRTKEEDIFLLPLDVCAFDTHKDAVQAVLNKFGHIDILLNNAGRGMVGKWWEVELQVDKDMWDVNVLGPVSLTQCVLPHMMERRQGQVVVVSSIAGLLAGARTRAYTGAKHAVQGYFGTLSNETYEFNIDVTLICPGPVESEFSASSVTSTGQTIGSTSVRKRMSTERCAYLSVVAIANRMFETWITENPQLLILYLQQLCPTLLKKILRPRVVKMIEDMHKNE